MYFALIPDLASPMSCLFLADLCECDCWQGSGNKSTKKKDRLEPVIEEEEAVQEEEEDEKLVIDEKPSKNVRLLYAWTFAKNISCFFFYMHPYTCYFGLQGIAMQNKDGFTWHKFPVVSLNRTDFRLVFSFKCVSTDCMSTPAIVRLCESAFFLHSLPFLHFVLVTPKVSERLRVHDVTACLFQLQSFKLSICRKCMLLMPSCLHGGQSGMSV